MKLYNNLYISENNQQNVAQFINYNTIIEKLSKDTSLASLINPLMILPKISGCPNILLQSLSIMMIRSFNVISNTFSI